MVRHQDDGAFVWDLLTTVDLEAEQEPEDREDDGANDDVYRLHVQSPDLVWCAILARGPRRADETLHRPHEALVARERAPFRHVLPAGTTDALAGDARRCDPGCPLP